MYGCGEGLATGGRDEPKKEIWNWEKSLLVKEK